VVSRKRHGRRQRTKWKEAKKTRTYQKLEGGENFIEGGKMMEEEKNRDYYKKSAT